MTARAISLVVDSDDLFVYPIATSERLESHSFVMLHYRRWLGSDFRARADHEVRAAFLELVFAAQDQGPVGTLPVDEDLLAKAADLPLQRWRHLMQLAVSPLYGWQPCITDMGRRRLYHPVVLEVAQAALKGRQDWYDKREGEAERKRLAALPALILRAGGAQGLADDKGYVLRLDEYLLEVLPPPAQRRVRRVREAMEAMELAALAAGSELYSAAG